MTSMKPSNKTATVAATHTRAGRVLYFEGAGCVPCGEVANCRIRTFFHSRTGKRIYLEISGVEHDATWRKAVLGKGHHLFNVDAIGHIDDCFTVEEAEGDRVERNLLVQDGVKPKMHMIPFTYDAILAYVNNLGGDFDAVEVAPELSGYRVHAEEHGAYNRGDTLTFRQA